MNIVGSVRSTLIARVAVFAALLCLVLGAGRAYSAFDRQRSVSDPLARVPAVSDEAIDARHRIAFLETRLLQDADDSDVYAKLAALYLQRLRETGALEDLGLALRAAHESLAIVPDVRNADGLTSLAQAEFASHEFGPARDHARRLTHLDETSAPYALLGDALAELGDYGSAERAYAEMRRRSHGGDENVATRTARLAQLRGDNPGAERGFQAALQLEFARSEPSRERIAWFEWQIGDTAFFHGDEARAQSAYDDALTAYPGYFRALASRGRLEAARGDFKGAIQDYESAVRILPDPTFLAELGDIYQLAGRRQEAAERYRLVEFIGHLSKINGIMYNRQLAMYYADHDLNSRAAYLDAKREYAIRRDILGADTLAWTALKVGRVREARSAMQAALRLGTQDPRLYYHAGMIARANGERTLGAAYLRRALALNPQFDPLQAVRARKALDD